MSGALATGCGAHLQTWRPYTLSYPGLVGLAGAALADGSPSAAHLWAAWAAPTLSWIAGHYLGDYFDRDLDATAKPQRPIPSGRLSPRAAVASGLLCALAAAVVTALAAWPALLLVAGGMAGIVAYSKVFKGRGLSGNAVRGALTALTVVFGAMTAGAEPRWPAVLLAALAFWAHDTASNLVGTLRDVEGDRSGGYHTLPVLRGVRYAARTAALLYAAAIVTAAACVPLTAPAGRTAFAALLLAATACGVTAFTPLLRAAAALTPVRALRAHEVLVAERLVLAGAVLSAGWGPTPALTLLLPLLALSVLTQARLRARHEFPQDTRDTERPPAPESAPRRAKSAPTPGPDPIPGSRAERHLTPVPNPHGDRRPQRHLDPAPDPRTEQGPDSRPGRGAERLPAPASDRPPELRPDPHRDRRPERHLGPAPDPRAGQSPDPRPVVPDLRPGRGADRRLDPAADSHPDGVGLDPTPDQRTGRRAEQSPDRHPGPGPRTDSHAGRRVEPRPDRDPGPVPDSRAEQSPDPRPGVPDQRPGRGAEQGPNPVPDQRPDPAADSHPGGVGPGSGQRPFPERAGGRSGAGADDPQAPLRAALRKDRPSSW